MKNSLTLWSMTLTYACLCTFVLCRGASAQSSISPKVLVKARANRERVLKSKITEIDLVVGSPEKPPPGACKTPSHHVGTCTAGTKGCTWTATAGDLVQPAMAGLVIDPATECVWGQPATAGTATVTVAVTDAKGKTSSDKLVLQVSPAGTAVKSEG